jgi:hypothetical protein
MPHSVLKHRASDGLRIRGSSRHFKRGISGAACFFSAQDAAPGAGTGLFSR